VNQRLGGVLISFNGLTTGALAVGNTPLYSATTAAFRKHAFVCGAKMHVERDTQKISCSTSGFKNT
jgi:Zn finger protein HypA/HybF involved in hydrogenase expression